MLFRKWLRQKPSSFVGAAPACQDAPGMPRNVVGCQETSWDAKKRRGMPRDVVGCLWPHTAQRFSSTVFVALARTLRVGLAPLGQRDVLGTWALRSTCFIK